MLFVDLNKFWKDDELSQRNNCFYEKAPQVALGIRMSDECVFAELGVEGNPWGHTSREQRIELNKRYNDKAEKIVGKRLLQEEIPTKEEIFPYIKRIGEVFEGTYTMNNNTGEWLKGKVSTPEELEKLLDRVDKLDLREFMLPSNWESEKKRIYEKYGKKPSLNRWIRGPVTLAMSIYGEENLMYLYYDDIDLYRRFSETIGRVILDMEGIIDTEAGYEVGKAPSGFGFADDNCALLSPEMYQVFGYPVLKKVFEHYSPEENDRRYQHSDSAMGHLLPILGKLNLTGCNFGPTVLVDEIRKNMPKTRIDGCIAPYTFMNNNTEELIAEVKRDCDMIKKTGTKGLNITTAGSINNGSSLESMRVVMHVIQNYGRY
jgi:uroporphyrinogen decarboxylase